MIEEFDGIKNQFAELASVLNAFKSEAVQLRLLEYLLSEQTVVTKNEKSKRKPSSKKPRPGHAPSSNEDAEITKKGKKAPTGAGAPATLTQMLTSNFFDKPRTINDIIEHCKHNLARNFKANDFSGKLGRLVRDGELTRKKNTDKLYEYKKA